MEMHFVRRRPVATVLAGLAIFVPPGPLMAEDNSLHGPVTSRERIALRPSRVIKEPLVAVSPAEAPARVIETSQQIGRHVPILMRLTIDLAEIPPRRDALQSRIGDDGKLTSATLTRHPAFATGLANTQIVVERVQHQSEATSPAGRWLTENISGGGVINNVQTVLVIAADGTLTGTGGCNAMTGKAVISANQIAFGAIASTRKACPPAVMAQEQKFFAALATARHWAIQVRTRKLILHDAAGKPVAVFAQM
jgi:putative lipoprotein